MKFFRAQGQRGRKTLNSLHRRVCTGVWGGGGGGFGQIVRPGGGVWSLADAEGLARKSALALLTKYT